MFSLCRNFYKWVKKRREKHITIIVLGLDNAGKTTLIYGLKSELPDSDVIPTMGFSSSKLVSGKYIIQYFDVGGAKNFRNVWKNYYSEVHGVIYVVDAADKERLAESKETLAKTLASEGIPDKPILVIANKQDLPGCLSAVEVTEQLGLLQHKDNRYHVAACQAKPANGQAVDSRIGQSLRWLLDSIEADFPVLNARVAKDTEERKAKELVRREEQKKRAEASKAARLREQAESEALEKAAAAAAAAAEPAGHPPAHAQAAPPADSHLPTARPPDDAPAGRRPAEAPHTAGALPDGFGSGLARTPPVKRTADGPPPPGPPAPASLQPPACRPMEIEPSTAAAPAAWGSPPPAAPAAERARMRALPPLPNAVESPLGAAVRPGGDRPPPRHLGE